MLIKERNGKLYMVYFAEIMLKLRGGSLIKMTMLSLQFYGRLFAINDSR